MKVAVLYRVIQPWRAPVFFKLSQFLGNENFIVYFGPDFKNSKVVSTNENLGFKNKKLTSLKLTFSGGYSEGFMPLSPFLFLNLLIERPDVVISEGASNLFNAFQGFLYCKLFRRRFIWWSLGELVNSKESLKKIMLKPLINLIEINSNAILTYSSQGANYFTKLKIDKEKIFIAVNVVDTSERLKFINQFDRKNTSNFNTLKVVYSGSLLKSKNLEVLLIALKILLEEKNIDIELNIIGQGIDFDFFYNKVVELNIENSVNFLGHKTGEDFSKALIQNDVLVMPGLGGLAISDGMVHGLAIISSHGDGCEKDLVKSGHNGYFLENISSNILAEKLEYLSQNPNELNIMKVNSYNMIINEYNIENYIKVIIDSIYSK